MKKVILLIIKKKFAIIFGEKLLIGEIIYRNKK
jgi:hypothetical protein